MGGVLGHNFTQCEASSSADSGLRFRYLLSCVSHRVEASHVSSRTRCETRMLVVLRFLACLPHLGWSWIRWAGRQRDQAVLKVFSFTFKSGLVIPCSLAFKSFLACFKN